MLYSIIGILVIIFDQLVKYWVDEHINYLNPSVDLIPNVLSLVRVQNDGAAFSFLSLPSWSCLPWPPTSSPAGSAGGALCLSRPAVCPT